MTNHFTVTIHDDNGVKQFNIHKIIKKALLYAALFLSSVAFVAVATILYLNDAVDAIEAKREKMQVAYDELKEKNRSLDESMKEVRVSLAQKRKELTEVSNTLSEIETLIGLAPLENMSLQQRADITKINSEHVATLMQFIPSGSPVKYKGVTSGYGYRIHPTLGSKELHHGLDMKAAMKTPVYATADGIVEWAGYHKKSGFGNLIILQHNYGFRTYFAHLNKVVIKSGSFVRKGDLIAYTGNSGMSSGPHLHYEIRFIQRSVNPLEFIQWSVKNYKDIFEKEKKIPWQSLITATAHIKVPKPTQTQPSSPLALQSKER